MPMEKKTGTADPAIVGVEGPAVAQPLVERGNEGRAQIRAALQVKIHERAMRLM